MTYMHPRKTGSCTTILVGKKASIDGSTMIARNEDSGSDASNPQRFVVINPADQPRDYHAVQSTVHFPLPANPLRYTSTPDADTQFGIWGESGINSANVAMTATETSTTNTRILGIDPLVENGIGEEDFLTITLPYIHSARDGVQRLGQLIEQYGTYESNGVAFSDQDEVWYFESIGGHHWAAIRIPDDAYVIAPNRFNIDHYDFTSDNTLFAADLPDLITQNNLNPDADDINLRHIFGSATIKDAHYNNPRTWFGQRYLNPSQHREPADQDLPFIMRAERKITIEDVKWLLSSHYQDTPYDPYGNGPASERTKFRPIGINRNQETHILQIRPNVPASVAGIHWLAFGPNTFNSLVPFYTTVTDTPACYRDTSTTFDLQKIYWLSRTTAILGDTNYALFSELADAFEQTIMATCRHRQRTNDQQLATTADVPAFLEQQNQQMADFYFEQANLLLGKMTALSATKMKLRFNLAD